jgi:hypothetical protein
VNNLIDEVSTKQAAKDHKYYGYLNFSDTTFDIFELDQGSLLKYFSKIILTKLCQVIN